MKDAVENTSNNDMLTKTKTRLLNLVSGISNMFRPNFDPADKEFSLANVNNHLKSPDEIEAECRFLCVSQSEEPNTTQREEKVNEVTTFKNTEFRFKDTITSDALPEYMEENY